MIFISAQPDEPYFLWQLELLLRNLKSFKVDPSNIHILIAFDKDSGPSPFFKHFLKDNALLGSFYCYPDLRISPKYASSIRANILKQHFKKFSELSEKTIFFHDSDILFSRLPRISEVETKNKICYVSDTRSYLDADYIHNIGGDDLLNDMANIIGISPSFIIKHKNDSGGAQYILKNITSEFWEKVEKDSEDLYVLLNNYNWNLWESQYPYSKEFRSTKRGIHPWCSDMWATLWNLWFFKKEVKIHSDLDFSWPFSPIAEWEEKSIQHYSGSLRKGHLLFDKSIYSEFTPWYDDGLNTISNQTCSYKIVELIRERKNELDLQRFNIEDAVILIYLDKEKSDFLETFKIFQKYIQKELNVPIYGLVKTIKKTCYDNKIFDKNYLYELLSKKKNIKKILYIPYDMFIDVNDIKNILKEDKDAVNTKILVNQILKVDYIFKDYFCKSLNMDLLSLNKKKFDSLDRSKITKKKIFLIKEIKFEQKNYLDSILNNRKIYNFSKKYIQTAYDLSS